MENNHPEPMEPSEQFCPNLACCARGEASSVTTGGKLDHRLMWLYPITGGMVDSLAIIYAAATGAIWTMYKDFPAEYYELLTKKNNFVLLETSRYDAENQRTFLFLDPIRVLQIDRVSDVDILLQAIQHQVQQGYYVAGYLGYECGSHFENIRRWENAPRPPPLAWFGVYNEPLIFNHATGQLDSRPYLVASPDPPGPTTTAAAASYTVSDIQFGFTWPQYRKKLARVKQYILDGDTYQINFTGRYHFTFEGSPLAFYQALKKKQQVSYGAYIRAAGQDILCFSPELFFRIAEDCITTKPMKGTAPRGCTEAEDQQQVAWLQSDEKNRAENVMIVDLLRNDLGRLCRIGSVHIPHLLTVEKYATLFQMTSTVEGIISGELDYTALFRSLFPCGSVTGAPKIRSMQIIRELETSPRGVYTGAIGYVAPLLAPPSGSERAVVTTRATAPWKAIFNVAIRTIVLHEGQGTMGIGSGIVYDSVAQDEYAECALKAAFLTAPFVEFALLEAILWDNGYRQLDKHLSRLAHSAVYFAYPYDHEQVITLLMQQSAGLVVGQRYKVRLTVDHTGTVRCESLPIEQEPSRRKTTIIVSRARTHTSNPFLYHKTTHRVFYDEAYRQAVQEGHTDIIFLNERGEITEGAISNIFIEKNHHLLTPPLHCGLLNGVYRQYILEERPDTREEVLSLKDVQQADRIFLCNAIKGWRQVTLASGSPS
jgi:para-aminobenzoate synthetase/4-amino-4-deoxychorismate lyase